MKTPWTICFKCFCWVLIFSLHTWNCSHSAHGNLSLKGYEQTCQIVIYNDFGNFMWARSRRGAKKQWKCMLTQYHSLIIVQTLWLPHLAFIALRYIRLGNRKRGIWKLYNKKYWQETETSMRSSCGLRVKLPVCQDFTEQQRHPGAEKETYFCRRSRPYFMSRRMAVGAV